MERPGPRNEAATEVGRVFRGIVLGSGRSPTSERVSRSAYHSGSATSLPCAAAAGLGAQSGV